MAAAATSTTHQVRLARPRLGLVRRRMVVLAAGKKPATTKPGKQQQNLDYGADWYTKTRELSRPRTVREEIEYRRAANLAANNGRERKDLYTDNWDGSEYKGSPFNILSLLAALFFLVPVGGLVFAYMTYGTLWG